MIEQIAFTYPMQRMENRASNKRWVAQVPSIISFKVLSLNNEKVCLPDGVQDVGRGKDHDDDEDEDDKDHETEEPQCFPPSAKWAGNVMKLSAGKYMYIIYSTYRP